MKIKILLFLYKNFLQCDFTVRDLLPILAYELTLI